MPGLEQAGKLLILAGLVIVVLGLFLVFGNRIPMIGRFPGDVVIERGNFRIFLPITTGLILSIVLTILVNLVLRLIGR